MPSGDIGLVRELIELQAPLRSEAVAERRRQYDRAEQTFGRDEKPGEAIDADGCPAEWVRPQSDPSQPVVIYIHGGGYSLGSTRSHRHLAAAIGNEAQAAVLSLDYRLAPECPFPAAVKDTIAATRWLLAQIHAAVVLVGDSAGGGLVLATLTALRDASDRLPTAGVCLSPWLDLTCSADALTRIAERDPLLSRAELAHMAGVYLQGADPREPLASPVFADLTGLPPLLIQVGSEEILLDDARSLALQARTHGVEVTLEEWPDMIHVWQWYFPVLREGREAIEAIASYIKRSAEPHAPPRRARTTRTAPASLNQEAHLLIAPETSGRGFLNWVYQFNGPLDTQALAHAVDDVVQRYEILRVRFELHSGQLYQVATPFKSGVLRQIDLSHQPKQQGLQEAVEHAASIYDSLSPNCDPSFSATLYRLDRKTSVLAMFVAEALVDSDSGSLLAAAISHAYARLAGTAPPPDLPEVSDASYLDYAESHAHDPAEITSSREYWVRQRERTTMPTRWPTSSQDKQYDGTTVTFELSPQEWTALASSARQLAITPYVLVLTCLQVALARVAQMPQLLVHTIVPQRNIAQKGVIGNFQSIARIATHLDPSATFKSAAQETAVAVAEAIEHSILPAPLALVANTTPSHRRTYLPDIRLYMFGSHQGPMFAGVRRRRFRLHVRPPAPLSVSSIYGPNDTQDFALSTTTVDEILLRRLADDFRMTLAEAAIHHGDAARNMQTLVG